MPRRRRNPNALGRPVGEPNVPKQQPKKKAAAPAPGSQITTTIGPGLKYSYTPATAPKSAPKTPVGPPKTSYTPGTPVTAGPADQYGNPQLPGSSGDRPYGPGGPPHGVGAPAPPGKPSTPGEQDILSAYGLPPDITATVDKIFADHPGDPQGAAAAAVAYIRGTAWYAQTFPGIAAARQIGFIGTDLGSEREYKQYYAQYNSYYRQYYGRDMTWDEANRLFSAGSQPTFVGQQFAGAAYVNANRNDIQYYAGNFCDHRLSEGDLTNYGLEQVGYDTPMGQRLQTQLQQAMARFQRVFQGTLATPNVGIGGAGLNAPSLSGTKTAPDVSA